MSLMPSCKDVSEYSSDYLDKNLSLRQRARFKLHIFICVQCRQYVDHLKLTIATIGAIGKTPEASPPDIDAQQVQDIVSQIQQHASSQPPQP